MEDHLAILILENPWDKPKDNPKRASVFPFIDGISKLHDNISVYYATFHEKRGFDAALYNDLRHTSEGRQILYIASHGNDKGLKDFSITKLANIIKKYKKIEGILIGSCFAGQAQRALEKLLLDTKVRWVVAYNKSINWLDSTLIDMSILNLLCQKNLDMFDKEENLVKAFKKALDNFNLDHKLGHPKGSEIKDTLLIIVKPKRSRVPVDISGELFNTEIY